jgi:putative DNA primase/helicase
MTHIQFTTPICNETDLIDRFIPQNSLILMLAPVDAGIAVVGTDILLHVASGRPWIGRPVQKGSVIGYGFDGSVCAELREGWKIHHSAEVPDTYLSKSELKLEDSGCVERVCRDALTISEQTGEPVRLIGIDAFSSRGPQENFARGISTVVHHLEQIRMRTGAAVMLLRHKSYGDRTNSTLSGGADVVLSLTRGGKLTNSNLRDEPIFLKFLTISLESEPSCSTTVVEGVRVENSLDVMATGRMVH